MCRIVHGAEMAPQDIPSDTKKYGGGYMNGVIEQAWASARLDKVFWWSAMGLFLLDRTAYWMAMGTIDILISFASLGVLIASAAHIVKATRLIGRSGWWGWAVGSFLFPLVYWGGYYHVKRVARPMTEAVEYADV